jgi:S1-C subfamily serine protease
MSAAGTDAWGRLSAPQQLRIVRALLRQRGPHWMKRWPALRALGAGYRLRRRSDGSGSLEVVREVCICFFVQRKWKTDRAHPQKLPSHVNVRPVVQGRRIAVRIPTDVDAVAGGGPQAGAANLTPGILVTSPGRSPVLGSACAVVKAADSTHHLLTCAHVVSSRLAQPPAGTTCNANDQTHIGSVFDVANPTGDNAVDAALVRIDDPAFRDILQWGYRVQKRATPGDVAALGIKGGLQVLVRKSVPLPGDALEIRPEPMAAEFRCHILYPLPLSYARIGGPAYVFSELIQYVANTRPGDSGAAVINHMGTLVGMHFWGGDNGTGYAIPAWSLFRPGTFKTRIAF